jgi:hypothetical protein
VAADAVFRPACVVGSLGIIGPEMVKPGWRLSAMNFLRNTKSDTIEFIASRPDTVFWIFVALGGVTTFGAWWWPIATVFRALS